MSDKGGVKLKSVYFSRFFSHPHYSYNNAVIQPFHGSTVDLSNTDFPILFCSENLYGHVFDSYLQVKDLASPRCTKARSHYENILLLQLNEQQNDEPDTSSLAL